jgi:hypothetical protein
MKGPVFRRAHDLEGTVRRRNGSGGRQILNVRRFRTRFPAGIPYKCKRCQKDGQRGRIQTSTPPQHQSPQRTNPMTVGRSIRPDHSISYLAEQNNRGVSPIRINFNALQRESRGANRSYLRNQPGKLRI